jgi:rhomboid protease GluP
MEPATRTAPERLPDGALRFTVRFNPPDAPMTGGDSNNLGLTAAGTVTLSPEEVVFADSRPGEHGDSRKEERRRFRLADIANVGYGEAENLIVVRTVADDRYVAMWMQTREDALALLRLLPRTTTPEFIEQQESIRRFQSRMRALAPRAPVTPTIVALNAVVFVLMLLAGAGLSASNPEVHIRFGSNYGPLTWSGEYWRLLASAFVHFGLFHIVLNMYALYNGGDLTERLYGSVRFAVIYLLSALAGSVVSGWWNPHTNSAGASGAVFGVYGALLVFFAVRRSDIPMQLLRSAGKGALLLCVYSLGFGLASSLFDSPVRIDNAAHIGGLLGGALSGFLLARPFEPEARARPQPVRIMAVALGVCGLLALLAAPLVSGGGERRAELDVNRLMHDLELAEGRAIGRLNAISRDLSARKISNAAAADAMREQVLQPWQQATLELRNRPPIEPADSLTARRLAAAQNLGAAYDRAFSLTVTSLANEDGRADPELQRAWEQLSRQAAVLRELEEEARD